MGMKRDIKDQVVQLLAPGEYETQLSDTPPGPGDNRLTFKNSGVRFKAVVLYIDMRGSTAVLNAHKPHSVAKIHKAYLFLATKLIVERGGQVRSYNGDSILAFFPGSSKEVVTRAVRAAMEIKYMLATECRAEFDRFSGLDFGIGIDVGEILCVKAGIARNDNHNDLVWLGNAVNRATCLSDAAKHPFQVWASQEVRDLMEEPIRVQGPYRVERWTHARFEYNSRYEWGWSTASEWAVE